MGIGHIFIDLFCGELSGKGGVRGCGAGLGHLTGVAIGYPLFDTVKKNWLYKLGI